MWFSIFAFISYAALNIYTILKKMPKTGIAVQFMACIYEGYLATYLFIVQKYIYGYGVTAVAVIFAYIIYKECRFHKILKRKEEDGNNN